VIHKSEIVNIHHCVFDKLFVVALDGVKIFDHVLVDIGFDVKQNNLCPCKSIIPHHRNRLYYRAVAVVGYIYKEFCVINV